MLLDLLQNVISSVPLLLLQGLLLVHVLLTVVFIVVLDMTEVPSSLLIAVAEVHSLPQLGATLLTMHGRRTWMTPFGILCN